MLLEKMEVQVDDLIILSPHRLILEVPEQEQNKLWDRTASRDFKHRSNRWQTYLNQLTETIFCQYIEEEPDLRNYLKLETREREKIRLWEWVNGTAITLQNTKLILIPSDENEQDELRVPREWVELKDWVGHYYLAVEINLEIGYLQILGYIPHQKLQNYGKYDPIDQTYVLPHEDLIEDLTAVWMTEEFSPSPLPVVEANPSLFLTEIEAQILFKQIQHSDVIYPRLEIPFSQWGGLLSQPQWRQALATRKQPPLASKTETKTNLKQWFQEEFQAGWQSLDELINPRGMNLALGFRKQQQGLTVQGVKLIDLGIQLGNQAIALVLTLCEVSAEKVEVRVQLVPTQDDFYLPTGLELALMSRSEKILQQVNARGADQLIQLKRFTCPLGKGFSVKMALDGFSWTETFVIQ